MPTLLWTAIAFLEGAVPFDLTLAGHAVHPHRGATLEPRPGVRMHVRRR